MDFRQRVPLGRTGLMVSRLGIASGYGAPAASIEKAFHEHGLNYLWISFPFRRQMRKALRNLLPRHRDEIVIVLPHFPMANAFFLRGSVEGWLRQLHLDTLDVVVLQDVGKPTERLFERAVQLRQEGKVRFIGMSSHDRRLLGRTARRELDLPVDRRVEIWRGV